MQWQLIPLGMSGSFDYWGGMVIPKVLTLQGVFGVVQGQEAFFEVFVVSIAVGASLQGSDFVINPFQGGGRERVVVPVEEASSVLAEGLRHGLNLADARGVRAATPGLEELLRSGLRALVPELPQILFEVMRHGQQPASTPAERTPRSAPHAHAQAPANTRTSDTAAPRAVPRASINTRNRPSASDGHESITR